MFLVPLLAGGGMRVKIVDAWTRQLPVASTRIGAEGIRCTDGEDILLADSAGGLAAAVLRLLRDPLLADRLAAAGRRTAAAHYGWRTVYPAWDAIYGGRA